MKVATTLIGLEETLKKESMGKIIYNGRVLFKKNKKLKCALIVYDLIKYFKFKDKNEIYENIKKINLKFKGTFRVDCSRIGKHIFNSQEIRQNVGEIIYNKNHNVNLNNPKNIFYVDIIDDYCFFGKNPVNLGKRNYKLRSSRDSLNPVIAFSLLKIANFRKNKILLDPFCSDGVVSIEAGLIGGKKLYCLNSDIKNASINSKIAKVKLNLIKKDLNWLDTIFKKESIDLIISKPIYPSKTKSINFVDKIIKELFHQADYILKKKGLMVLISPKTEILRKYADIYGFKIKEELKIKSGDLTYNVLSFRK